VGAVGLRCSRFHKPRGNPKGGRWVLEWGRSVQFAVKRLTMSDLTFFEVQYRRQQQEAKAKNEHGSKQKGINLNADVFVDIAFPAARGDGTRQRFNLPLTIYGPGARREPQVVTRKVISAAGGAKNWRLNGELIPDPDFDPGRYSGLTPGDLAVFGLEGDPTPTAIYIVLISWSEADDQTLYEALGNMLGNRSMVMLASAQMEAVVDLAASDHPIRELFDAELDLSLEEAALGSPEAEERLRRRASPRRTTTEAMRAARLEAEATGLRGEALLNEWLRSQQTTAVISDFKWISEETPLNPWDFEVTEPDGTLSRIELKTTKGSFGTPFHLSQSEVAYAADATAPKTDLYRVYEISEGVGKLAISEDIREFAREILKSVAGLGTGIVPESYLVDVSRLGNWRHVGEISAHDDPDDTQTSP